MKTVNRRSTFGVGDIIGGLSGAAVALPQSMGLGIVLFSVMGFDASTGALAGLIGATILLLISGGVGATVGMISAPNGPMTMMLVGVMSTLSAEGASSGAMLLNLSAILMLVGIFQILFALLGGARLIKYIPYPVVAGLVTGVGVLMVKSQITLLAKDWNGSLYPDSFESAFPSIIALLTMLAMYLTPKLTARRIPAAVGAFVSGLLFFYGALGYLPFEVNEKWVVGTIPSIVNMHFDFPAKELFSLSPKLVVLTALALTILGMTDCLVTSLVADSRTGRQHDSRKEMVAQGAAELVIGFLGALGGWGTKGATLVCIEAGGRRWAPVVAGLFFMALMLFAGEVGRYLPLSVLAGIVAMVGVGMIDLNILTWARHKRTRLDAITAIGVIIIIVSVNLVVAVGVGVLFSILLFISMQSKNPIIHRRIDAREHRSISKRPVEEERCLEKYGEDIVMYELKGNLFFATADKLRTEIGGQLRQDRILILHFRRVRYVDMSAMIVLLQIGEDARNRGCELLFCHLHKGLGFGKKVKKAFRHIDSKHTFNHRVFADSDTAFEYAENRLLQKHGYKNSERAKAKTIAENDLCIDMASEQIEEISAMAIVREVSAGERLFERGDYGDSLYMLLEGNIEIRLYVNKREYKRLAKYGPGTFFGEISFIEPGPRTATAFVLEKCVLAEIGGKELKKFEERREYKTLIEILNTIAIRLSEELRRSADDIRRLEEW